MVHAASRVEADTTVPIGWVAVGDPARLFPPEAHDDIWAVQQGLDFPRRVFGVGRASAGQTRMPEITERYSRALARYEQAEPVDV